LRVLLIAISAGAVVSEEVVREAAPSYT
jgi:hypothetical protein